MARVKKRRARRIVADRAVEKEEVVRWAKHYSSMHQILLVGDGDFSFSLSLANSFGSAANIVATSLDSYGVLLKKYSKAQKNVDKLKEMGGTVLHDVDATKMKFHSDLGTRKFDRIVYNFPHAGFKGQEIDPRLIKLHRRLVRGFFRNASRMLRPYGEVHVTHKINAPFCHWNLEELASMNYLILVESAHFNIKDYPGYNNKKGDGSKSDDCFPLGKCTTFKFIIGRQKKMRPLEKENDLKPNHSDCTNVIDDHLNNVNISYQDSGFPFNVQRIPSISTSHPMTYIGDLERVDSSSSALPRLNISSLLVHDGQLSPAPVVSMRSIEPQRSNYNPIWLESSRRVASSCKYLKLLDGIQRWSVAGLAWVKKMLAAHAEGDVESQKKLLAERYGYELEAAMADKQQE